jgi:Surface antigen variable number repeat
MKHKYFWFISLFLLCGSSSQVLAGIRPSFNLETCSWNATDIVVATEGKRIDGVFSVLESWKGDLNPGDTIRVPELASFQPEPSRAISDAWYQKEKSPHLVVTGERMILFLKRDSHESAPETDNGNPRSAPSINWRSASFFDEMNVSVVWIEQGQAFGFVQMMNPGPSLLIRLGASEDELKNRVLEVKDIQALFVQAAAIAEPAKKAAALEPFAHHSLHLARDAAFGELKKCGKAALPVMRRMLADDSLLDSHAHLVEVMAEAGKSDVGADLTALIEKDLEFWKRTGPVLKKGWWNGEGFDSLEAVEPLRDRYGRDYDALLALTKTPYWASEAIVTEFRNLWRSLPQLEEIGSDQLSKAVDQVLRELDRVKSNVNAIRFEGLQAFDDSEMLKVLREKRVISHDSPVITPDLIEKAQTAIKEFLASRGYTHATIAGEADSASRTLTLTVYEGTRAGIGQIRFEGNRLFSSEQLARQMKQCLAEYEDDGYDSEIFDACLHRLNNFVRSKGYLEAKFHDPETKETKDGLVVTIHADEGILYRLGKMTIEGSKFLSSEQIRSTMGLQAGDIANGERISKALFEDLKKQYGSHGFIQYTAEINPTFKDNPQNANEGIVDFEVTIEEGKQFRLRSIKFVGSDLLRKQLLGLLLIREGDIFNQQLYEQSIEKLNESGLFDPIDGDRDAHFKTDEDQGLVSIVIRVSGGPRGTEPEERTLKLRQPEPPQ